MDFFQRAKSVRLHSYHDKYLLADDDKESVCQDRNGTIRQAKWEVEMVPGYDHVIRLKSCYGKYLTASNVPFLLGMTGKKVLQTLPRRLDSSVEWEPFREGMQIRLKTRYGNFLRANGGLPPWRNSITHDRTHRHRSTGQNWDLWDVDIVELRPKPAAPPPPEPKVESAEDTESEPEEPDSPSSISLTRRPIPRKEDGSFPCSPVKAEGRLISYRVADENGDFMEEEEATITFKGSGLEELVETLEDETGLEDIILCSHWGGKLYPLRLQLPPNNAQMHVVVVPPSSRAAGDVEVPGSPNTR
ncbi:uncharacterized protein LOC116215461 isoform X1 [Punica granatum]|uniref:Uncharacterized protein LOC116215461 isoform X1 n=1 Tax=Punica granatum TaxID=22663 RepID=A0A218WNB7_PUNGR|nr:uncharacterized protein LOC116215461 isoform X1 [Punica granatum]OWM73978.1 hypothetical protein CDL15_Pgr022249 [Punica granatum]